MNARHDISGTAFVINVSRARREDISQDAHARLWVTPEAETLWDELATEVYPSDDVSSSLRNRFYLEHLRSFETTHDAPVCIGVAAGFSDYSWLIGPKWRCVEIDYPHIVAHKRERTSAWQAEGRLPRREVRFHGADLSSAEGVAGVGRALADWTAGRPTFVIMEGITYYLPKERLDALLAHFAARLAPGSLVAFEHWTPDAANWPVFVRLSDYLARRFGWNVTYTLLDDAYASAVPGLDVVEAMDMAEAEGRWSDTRVLQERDQRLPIFFKVLRKT